MAEALALTPADVDPATGVVGVAGGRGRRIEVGEADATAFADWLAARGELGLDGDGPLFCTREGTPLETSYVRRLMARLGREAGVAGPVNARGLRDAYAARRLGAGAGAAELQRELGFGSLASAQRYIRQLAVAPPPAEGSAAELDGTLIDALLAAAHCALAVVRAVRGAGGRIEDFVVEYLNPAAGGLTGLGTGLARGSSVREHFPSAPIDGSYARWIDLIETGGRQGELRVHEVEGRARPLRVRRVAIGDRVVLSWEDVSAQRAAEAALAGLAARHEALLQALPAGVFVLGPDGAIEGANAAAARLSGLPLERVVGRTAADPRWRVVQPDGRTLPVERLPGVRAGATGAPVRDVLMGIVTPSGETSWVRADAEPVEAAGGPPYGVVVTIADVRDTLDAEARAAAAEAALAFADEYPEGALMRCRPDGVILWVARRLADDMERPAAEIVGRRCDELVAPEFAGAVREAYRRAMETRETVTIDHTVPTPTRILEVRRRVRAVHDPTTDVVREVHSLIGPRG